MSESNRAIAPFVLVLVLVLAVAASPAIGQDLDLQALVATGPAADSAERVPLGYGIGDRSVLNVTAPEFQPMNETTAYKRDALMHWYVDGGSAILNANVALPSGARIEMLELTACDDNAVDDIRVILADNQDPGSSAFFRADFETAGSGGCNYWSETLSSAVTVDNLNNTYTLLVILGSDSTLRFRGVRVYWRRQVSPAPASATFGDVPTGHPFFQFVEALSSSGITAGCGGGNFCPDDPLTRGQMAVFLSGALGLHFPF